MDKRQSFEVCTLYYYDRVSQKKVTFQNIEMAFAREPFVLWSCPFHRFRTWSTHEYINLRKGHLPRTNGALVIATSVFGKVTFFYSPCMRGNVVILFVIMFDYTVLIHSWEPELAQ